ncbi:unnamed protein product [Parajaminaea phylloscopi]
MTQLTLQFLQLLVLLLSLSSVENNNSPAHGVAALPVSRRSSTVDITPVLDDRATSPRVGLAISGKPGTNFPSIHARNGEADRNEGHSLPLKRLEPPSALHPQMLLQQHLNRANAKLLQMQKRGSFSEQDRKDALLRRRSAIIGDIERRSVSLSERSPKQNGRVGFAGTSHGSRGFSGGRGVDEREEALSERDLTMGAEPHNLLPQVIQSGSATQTASGGQGASVSHHPSTARQAKASATVSSAAKPNSTNKSSPKTLAAGTASTYNIAKLGFPTAALKASENSGLIVAASPNTEGSLALDIEANDVGYIAEFSIGTAGGFKLLVDSGSADTWVPSTVCSNCSTVHHKLGKSTSKSFKAITPQQSFSIAYGTGSVDGHLGKDTLYISDMKLPNHTFGLATTESIDFSDPSVPFDGLMGLAQQKLSSSHTPTPIDSLFSSGQVPQPVMGYHLGRASDGNNGGEVTFGGVDPFKFQGELTEMDNVSQQGFWEATIGSISFNGKDISLPGSFKRSAILDTGTTLIVAPQSDADALHSAIPGAKSDGQGGYTIPCTTAGQVAFSFGGKTWAMDARDMVFLPVDGANLKGDCISSVSAGNVGQKGEWLVGAAFLKNVYFATNAKSNTIALGVLA